MKLDSIEEAIAEIAAGRCIIVVDDADRENEGDLVAAASLMTPETMAFIIRAGGLVCAPVTASEAKRLNLAPMVSENDAPLATAFTVSIDYREGLTTGISSEERSNTVRALANGNVGATDFVRPGHIFPLIARDGGVLMRSGHTEAAVDLARLAGQPPVGVICEMLDLETGATMKGPQLEVFAREHGLKLVSIADLIAWRQQREQLVTRIAEFDLETEIGTARAHVYSTPFDDSHHLALVFGEPSPDSALVRLHRETPLDDVFGGASRSLSVALARIQSEGAGALVYLREGATGVLSEAPKWTETGREDHASENARQEEWKEVGLGAQILRDLGFRSIRLISSKERQYVGLSGFGVEISGTEIVGV